MALVPGTRLGPYEILTAAGAGGMGEVYRAKDTRLDRIVAVKVLPEPVLRDPGRRQRLEREARSVSSLSHPHICTLHDIGSQDGVDYLVMEFLEGETLAERLAKGPLPMAQVLRHAVEIAGALDAAHRHGVVHRDLKPGNIMLTRAGAKLLDFGLARADPEAAPGASGLSATPTHTRPLTAEGTVVGTVQYMAPEQLEGRPADARSDLFAFGAVLHEMATGRRAFEGKSPASLIAAILSTEPPPISSLQPLAPPTLDRLVKTCLAKDPEERWQAAGDVVHALKWISEGASGTDERGRRLAPRQRWDRVGWLLAVLLLLVLIAGAGAWWAGARRTQRTMYFSSAVPFPASDVALSPDGRVLAMVAFSDRANASVIWTQELGSREAAPLPGTDDASHPFWSPDGRLIGFFAKGKLKKVDVSGGSAQVVCDAPHGRGGTWNREGTVLFAPDGFGGLERVSSSGGSPTEVTKPDRSRFETSHRWPFFLPDGRHFIYLAANFAGQFDKNAIFLGSLDSDERRPIVSASSNAVYVDPGYLLYVRDGALVAARFDFRHDVLGGELRTITDGVQYYPQTDLALFTVAGPETLVTQSGKGVAKSQLIWFDRSGRSEGSIGSPGLFANPRLSPDGRRVAVDQTDSDGRHVNIWIHELANDSVSRFTFGPWLDQVPIWSPDGKQVVFSSEQRFIFGLYEKNADGSGSDHQIADLGAARQGFWDWSRDGKYLLAFNNAELWYLSSKDLKGKPYLQAKWIVENAQFSPDARWVAYSTNETGNFEVYVSPFPSASSKWQVSRGGGKEPRWRKDGKELFYLSGEGRMMAVEIKTGSGFEAGSPVTLFQTHPRQHVSTMDVSSYDVTADGRRFLINTRVDDPTATPVSIVLNWASAIDQ
jgi:Tol biopolymer transport system component